MKDFSRENAPVDVPCERLKTNKPIKARLMCSHRAWTSLDEQEPITKSVHSEVPREPQ